MTLLTRLVGARNAVEVGTFTGYSALCIARGPARRRASALLRRQRRVDLGRPPVLGAGRRGRPHRAEDRAGGRDAAGAADRTRPIDLAFIDADKPNYAAYYEELLPRLRPNGVILVDNVLWGGNVIERRPGRREPGRDPGVQRHGRGRTTGSTP